MSDEFRMTDQMRDDMTEYIRRIVEQSKRQRVVEYPWIDEHGTTWASYLVTESDEPGQPPRKDYLGSRYTPRRALLADDEQNAANE